MKRTIALAALIAGVVAASSCARAEKRAAARDSAADSAAADTTAADTTQATEIPESRLAALAPRDYPAGFYEVKMISTAPTGSDSIIRQQMSTVPGWVAAKALVLEDTAAAPEIVVRADSSTSARMVAYVDFVASDQGGWESRYAVNDSTLYAELARLGDDEYGMNALGVKGSWARVVYAYTPSGERRIGWVKLVPGKIEYTTEQQELDE